MKTIQFVTLLTFTLFFKSLSAQIDREFWFAAPEISSDSRSLDGPTVLRMTTFSLPAKVTISIPANPTFTPVVLSIPANSTSNFSFASFLNLVETKPANTAVNTGIHITSTADITCYYENLSLPCDCNPEIFVLKGKVGLGNLFYTPFQTRHDNRLDYNPLPKASFDIVATQDSTIVEINNTKGIVGHAANSTFTILLNRGQTWSGESTSPTSFLRPIGSRISSNKPIAVTVKDDLVGNGDAADLMGDQILPVTSIGSEYIVFNGSSIVEYVYIVATDDTTRIWIDSALVTPTATLNKGEWIARPISSINKYMCIKSNKNIYVLHQSGIANELAEDLIPPLQCTGSRVTAFTRSSNQSFYAIVLVKNGGEGNFLVNGMTNVIKDTSFIPIVWGGGEWKGALIDLSASVGTGTATRITNSTHNFHLGILNGRRFQGVRYGYFTNYSNFVETTDTLSQCISIGDTIQVEPGYPVYIWNDTLRTNDNKHVINRFGGFSVVYGDSSCLNRKKNFYIIEDTTALFDSTTIEICFGDTIILRTIPYYTEGSHADTFVTSNGCDSFFTTVFVIRPELRDSVYLTICEGQSIKFGNQYIKNPGIYLDTMISILGCDSTVYLTLSVSTNSNIFPDTIWFFGSDTLISTPNSFDYSLYQGRFNQNYFRTDSNTIVYWLGMDEDSCIYRDTIVFVKTIPVSFNIAFPDAFTPNGDNTNDIFKAFGYGVDVFYFEIYNRWGERVFFTENFSSGWDGTYKNEIQPFSVYSYVCRYSFINQADEKTIKGNLTLIR